MNVASYNFQSSYPNPVQVGTLDPSSVKQEDDSTKVESEKKVSQPVQSVEANPAIESQRLLDVYA